MKIEFAPLDVYIKRGMTTIVEFENGYGIEYDSETFEICDIFYVDDNDNYYNSGKIKLPKFTSDDAVEALFTHMGYTESITNNDIVLEWLINSAKLQVKLTKNYIETIARLRNTLTEERSGHVKVVKELRKLQLAAEHIDEVFELNKTITCAYNEVASELDKLRLDNQSLVKELATAIELQNKPTPRIVPDKVYHIRYHCNGNDQNRDILSDFGDGQFLSKLFTKYTKHGHYNADYYIMLNEIQIKYKCELMSITLDIENGGGYGWSTYYNHQIYLHKSDRYKLFGTDANLTFEYTPITISQGRVEAQRLCLQYKYAYF